MWSGYNRCSYFDPLSFMNESHRIKLFTGAIDSSSPKIDPVGPDKHSISPSSNRNDLLLKNSLYGLSVSEIQSSTQWDMYSIFKDSLASSPKQSNPNISYDVGNLFISYLLLAKVLIIPQLSQLLVLYRYDFR